MTSLWCLAYGVGACMNIENCGVWMHADCLGTEENSFDCYICNVTFSFPLNNFVIFDFVTYSNILTMLQVKKS